MVIYMQFDNSLMMIIHIVNYTYIPEMSYP